MARGCLALLACALAGCDSGPALERVALPVEPGPHDDCWDDADYERTRVAARPGVARALTADPATLPMPGVGNVWPEDSDRRHGRHGPTAFDTVHDDGTFEFAGVPHGAHDGRPIDGATRIDRWRASTIAPGGALRVVEPLNDIVRVVEMGTDRERLRFDVDPCLGRYDHGPRGRLTWLDATTLRFEVASVSDVVMGRSRTIVWDVPSATRLFDGWTEGSSGAWLIDPGEPRVQTGDAPRPDRTTIVHARTGARLEVTGRVVAVSDDGGWVASYHQGSGSLLLLSTTRPGWRLHAPGRPSVRFSPMGQYAWVFGAAVIDLDAGRVHSRADQIGVLLTPEPPEPPPGPVVDPLTGRPRRAR